MGAGPENTGWGLGPGSGSGSATRFLNSSALVPSAPCATRDPLKAEDTISFLFNQKTGVSLQPFKVKSKQKQKQPTRNCHLLLLSCLSSQARRPGSRSQQEGGSGHCQKTGRQGSGWPGLLGTDSCFTPPHPSRTAPHPYPPRPGPMFLSPTQTRVVPTGVPLAWHLANTRNGGALLCQQWGPPWGLLPNSGFPQPQRPFFVVGGKQTGGAAGN